MIRRVPKCSDSGGGQERQSTAIVHHHPACIVTVTQPQILIPLAVISSSWFRIIRPDPA
jgi:hypothetical protein